MSEVTATGSCLCGSVRYQVNGPVTDVTACHCSQCRRQSGHYWASSNSAEKDFELLKQDLIILLIKDRAIGCCSICIVLRSFI